MAIGRGWNRSARYCTDKALIPLVISCFDATANMSHVIPDLISDSHFKDSHFRKP
jgi:hypothetical protein